MSDSKPHDQSPSDPGKAAAWDSVSDRELDAALSSAATLASDLVQQLGQPEASPTAPSPNPLEDPRSDLDAELSQLSELTTKAAQELDAQPATSSRAVVPDFMSEFMDPPSETPPPPPSTPIPAPTAPRPRETVLAAPPEPNGPQGVVGGVINITIPAGKLRQDAQSQTTGSADSVVTAPRPGLVERALNPIAKGIELADKPFANVGGKIRTILGWSAIGLLLTAAILAYVRLG